MNTIDYLYLVLVPVAEVFRKEIPEKNRQMSAIRNAKQCRVKFSHKATEKKWQAFCAEHELKNDATIEY